MVKLHFEKQVDKAINIGFEHGKYADLWSLVHINSGLLLGIITVFLHIPIFQASIMVFILFVAYEAFEMFTDTIESITNSITDIVIEFLAFLVSYFIFTFVHADNTMLGIFFILIALSSIVLDYFGWTLFIKKEIAKNKKNTSKKDVFVSVQISNKKAIAMLAVITFMLIGSFII